MSHVAFRLAHPGEEEALTALCVRSKAHWGYDQDFLDATLEDMTVKSGPVRDGLVLVAEDQTGEIRGVSALGDLGEAVFEIDLFFLDPSCIGQGLGRPLFEATAKLAAERGGKSLKIVSDPNAEGFYARMGAARIGEEPSAYIPGRRLPLMTFEL